MYIIKLKMFYQFKTVHKKEKKLKLVQDLIYWNPIPCIDQYNN